MLGLIWNMGPGETLLIGLIVVLVFGGRLPAVAKDVMRLFYKLRRSFEEVRREVDLDGELRRIRREVESSADPFPRSRRAAPRELRAPEGAVEAQPASPPVAPGPAPEPPPAQSEGEATAGTEPRDAGA